MSDFGSVDGYERHVVTRHPDLPGYPVLASNVEQPLDPIKLRNPSLLNGIRICEQTCHPTCAFHFHPKNCTGCPVPVNNRGDFSK